MMCEIKDTFINSTFAHFRIVHMLDLGACSHRPVRLCPTPCADVFRASMPILLCSLLRFIAGRFLNLSAINLNSN